MVNRSLSIACISMMSAHSTQHLVHSCHLPLSTQGSCLTGCFPSCCRVSSHSSESNPIRRDPLTRQLCGYQTCRDVAQGMALRTVSLLYVPDRFSLSTSSKTEGQEAARSGTGTEDRLCPPASRGPDVRDTGCEAPPAPVKGGCTAWDGSHRAYCSCLSSSPLRASLTEAHVSGIHCTSAASQHHQDSNSSAY